MTNPVPCRFGRAEATALKSMHIRARFNRHGQLQFVALKPRPLDTVGLMTARFQPRDAGGRFVPYSWLRAALTADAVAMP